MHFPRYIYALIPRLSFDLRFLRITGEHGQRTMVCRFVTRRLATVFPRFSLAALTLHASRGPRGKKKKKKKILPLCQSFSDEKGEENASRLRLAPPSTPTPRRVVEFCGNLLSQIPDTPPDFSGFSLNKSKARTHMCVCPGKSRATIKIQEEQAAYCLHNYAGFNLGSSSVKV